MRILLYVSIILLFPVVLYAQPKNIDSLLAVKRNITKDSNGVNLLLTITYVYMGTDPVKAIANGKEALALSKKIGWQRGEANSYTRLGSAHFNKTDYPTALEYYFKALKMYEAMGNKKGIAYSYTSIGQVYWAQRNGAKSLEYEFKGMKLAEELKDTARIIYALVNIGAAHLQLGDNEKSAEAYQKGLVLAEASRDESTIMSLTSTLAGTYTTTGNYAKSLAYNNKALKYAIANDNKQHTAVITANMGNTYLSIAMDSAAIPVDSLIPRTREANIDKGIEYLKKGIELCIEIQYNKDVPSYAAALAYAYNMKNDYKNAYEYMMLYAQMNDSIYSTENNQKMAALETQRAVELKDKDIEIAKLALAKKKNEAGFFIGGIILLTGIAVMLFRNARLQKRNNKLLIKEKKRSDDLLLNILPAEVAEELKASGDSRARQYEEVSVLFTDFVNFTGTAETLSPQALVQELHECFSAFDAIIERNGLEKIKTIGDAYMAVCGLPNSDSRHAQRTVQAALEIRDFIEQRKKEQSSFSIRIGVNSGSVVAGIVGVKKFAYDIWGDAVNTAARMEQNGEPGEINITHNTYELIKSEFDCVPRGKISVKGKGDVEMFFVKGVASA
jgi:adenylate cyclase